MKQKLFSILALLLVAATGAWAEDIEVDGGSRTISSDVSSDYFYMYGGTLTIEKGATVVTLSSFYFDEGSKIYLHGTLQGSAGEEPVWNDGCVIHIYLNDGAKYTLSGATAPSDACLIYYGYDAATDGNGTVSVKNGAVEVTSSSTGYESTNYTFTASPNSGYKFKNWTKGAGGEVLGTDASINVTCEQNGQYQVYANFEEDAPEFTATFKAGNDLTIQGGKATVTVTEKDGTTAYTGATLDENGKLTPLYEGQTITMTAAPGYKFKSVEAKTVVPGTNLATITANYEAKDGETLYGKLGSNVKISIADGATVTLKDVTINGVDNGSYAWAGITCAGDATITLEGTNTVKGFHGFYPGIYVPEGKTLTIEGEGSLNASGNGRSTGIGGGFHMHCGDIVINGGNITATGGEDNAGIGGGEGDEETVIRCGKITINGGTVTATCGEWAAGIGGGDHGASNDITITGGTVTATGGKWAAGIGGGNGGSCGAITISGGTVTATGGKYGAGIGGGNNNGASGTITITSGVTQVTATKGEDAPNSIGKGDGGEVISVTIEDYDKVIQN